MIIMNSEAQLRQFKSAIAMLMIINMLLLIAIINIKVFALSSGSYVVKEDIHMCLPCECLGLNPGDHVVGIERVGDKGRRCCASNINYLQTLIDLYAGYWMRKKHTQECSHSGYNDKDAKPVIKLVSLTYRQSGQNDLMMWAEEHALGIHSNGIGYDRGFIVIKQSGFYQVYSQVAFEKDVIWRETMNNESAFIYQHCVILIENERIPYMTVTKTTLLARHFNARTCRSGLNAPKFKSFLDGIFYLKDGDKLGVRVSNLDYIKPQPHKTFFGAHMI